MTRIKRDVSISLPGNLPALSGLMGELPGGSATIPATMLRMWQQIHDALSQIAVYSAARQITRHLPQKAVAQEANALFQFVQKNIRYVRDPHLVEALQTPSATLQLKTGDCDDKTILLASLLLSIGIPVKLIVGGFVKGRYTHVWLRAKLKNQWVAMDPTEPFAMGWEPHMPSRMIMKQPNF